MSDDLHCPYGTREYPMWKVRLCAPRVYRHPCGAVVELDWDYNGPGGLLSIRWGRTYLERRIELPPREEPSWAWRRAYVGDIKRSHLSARLVYEATVEMLREMAASNRQCV